MAKVLILAGDAAESLEVMYPYQRLLEEGYTVHIAGPSRKKLRFVIHEFVEGYDTYTEKPGYSWPADLAFAEVDPADYAALVIPGGRAPEYIRNDPDVLRIIRHFFAEEAGGEICHAPLALAAAGVLHGRRTAAYPALEPDVRAAGAEFVDAAAVVDGLMVSARAWPDNPSWMRAFLELLRRHTPPHGRRPAEAPDPGLALRPPIPSLPSSATWSSVSPTSAASTFSSRWATLAVPGIGSITGERCSSQASASCEGVTPSLSLIR
jgi:protease I